jgi:hypothetical protein
MFIFFIHASLLMELASGEAFKLVNRINATGCHIPAPTPEQQAQQPT